ncbi:MAG: hypothetical protein ABI113_19350 [Mucilaginibacter sp.]
MDTSKSSDFMAHRAYRFVAQQVNLFSCHVVVTLNPRLAEASTMFVVCLSAN